MKMLERSKIDIRSWAVTFKDEPTAAILSSRNGTEAGLPTMVNVYDPRVSRTAGQNASGFVASGLDSEAGYSSGTGSEEA